MENPNLKTILYILFGIGWLVYNFMKKNAAKKNAPVPRHESAPDTEQNQKDVITMLEELLGDKSAPKVPEQIPAPPIAKKQKLDNSSKSSLLKSQELKQAKSPTQSNKLRSSVQIADELEDDIIDLDPRKMIIYSEILKRPNY